MMQAMELQTERTILRPFTLDDALHAFSWFGDQEVMKFTSYVYSPSLVLSGYLSDNLEYAKLFLMLNISK
jgi:RimJ/RimL family protein N-acetyltransferase